MKPIPGSFQSLIKLSISMRSRLLGKFYMLFLVLFSMAPGLSAQSIIWSESYQQGSAPTTEQHQRWTDFLTSLKGKNKFVSVTLSGTFDEVGKTLSDSAAVNTLAALLTEGTVGSVVSGGQTWTVTKCDIGNGVFGVGLKVDGTGTSCVCADNYALRPLALNDDWGGVNSPPSNEGQSCSAASQTLKLVFYSGVKVVAQGPTEICEGGTVVLKAQADICSTPLAYVWSTGETTESIIVSKPGTYSVTASDGNGCSASSAPFSVTNTTVSVTAGDDAIYCGEPVQLNAVGTSAGGKATTTVHKFCLFDSPGSTGGTNCEFTAAEICLEGQTIFKAPLFYSTMTSVQNPVEIKYTLYYSSWDPATFKLYLNDEILHTFIDELPIGDCGAVPLSFSFTGAKLKGWKQSEPNKLAIEGSAGEMFAVAGLSVEVITSNVSYNWTPSDGLDVTTIANPKASPSIEKDYTVTYTDANGCKASDQVNVAVCPPGPIAKCQPVTKNAAENCAVTVSAADFDAGSSSPAGLSLTYSISQTSFGLGTHNVIFTVTDSNDMSSTCTTTITVKDATAPIIVQPNEVVVKNDAGSCSASVVLPIPAASDNCSFSLVNDQPDNLFDVGPTTVTWTATDPSGNKHTVTQLVTVTNAAPVVNSITGPSAPIAIGTTAELAISYQDDNLSHATVDWGDGSPATIVSNPPLSFKVVHIYESTGTFPVNVRLTDLCGDETAVAYGSITVYDRRGGAVRGGGAFESPAGAYIPDFAAVGRLNFSFDAKYSGMMTTPQGSAMLTFKGGDFKFKNNQYELLIIDGQTARLTGTGSLNGTTGYDILIAMVDDDSKLPRDRTTKTQKKADRVRVKIWDPSGTVVYDTQPKEPDDAIAKTYLSSGSIEIISTEFTAAMDPVSTVSSEEGSTSLYPNPFVDYINIQFATESTEDIVVSMMDLAGRVIATGTFPVSADGRYTLDLPEKANVGTYLLSIRQGKRIQRMTAIRN